MKRNQEKDFKQLTVKYMSNKLGYSIGYANHLGKQELYNRLKKKENEEIKIKEEVLLEVIGKDWKELNKLEEVNDKINPQLTKKALEQEFVDSLLKGLKETKNIVDNLTFYQKALYRIKLLEIISKMAKKK